MTKENQKIYFLALFMVICAVFLRVIGKLGVLSVHGGIIRSLLYITLYIGWGIFAYRRILQIQVRRYMLAVSSLCVFWFVIRSMKYYLVTNVIFVRYIWYFYYLPMLFIPLFAVFISMSLGKPENFRLSNWAMGLYIPTTLLLLLVLTNDFHQLVFAFSDGAIWDDKHFSYAIGYYFVFGWEVFCAVASFGIMLTKCRLAQRTKYLPILLLCIAVIYAVIYASGAKWMQLIGGDIAAAQCLLFVGIFESCIACGLIQTNTGYEELFRVSRLGAQITNQESKVCLASANAKALTEEQRISAESKPVFADKETLIKSKPIRFGHVLWQEDISEIIEAIEQIEENCRDLSERNHIRQKNLETKKKILALQEKNKATDLLHQETAQQIDLIDRMLGQYNAETDEPKRCRLLAGVAVAGAYIKRYGNLLLTSQRTETASIRDLVRCFEDSFVNLELLEISSLCTCNADITLKTKDMLHIYRSFETIVEDCMFSLQSVWVNVRERKGQVLLSIDFVCDTDLSVHGEKADLFSCEEGNSRFTFKLQKGGEKE